MQYTRYCPVKSTVLAANNSSDHMIVQLEASVWGPTEPIDPGFAYAALDRTHMCEVVKLCTDGWMPADSPARNCLPALSSVRRSHMQE